MRRILTMLAFVLACLAQSQTDPAVASLQEAARLARSTSPLQHPDQPLWREAIRLGEQLLNEDPQNPELALLLARIYSDVAWHARAYSAWLDYARLSGDAPDGAAFAEAAQQLGFARFSFGDLAGAAGYYETLLEFQPENPEALFWTGRIRLEMGEGEAASAAFASLLALNGSIDLPASQLQLARNALAHGAEAALSFARASTLYDAGQAEAALAGFEEAFERSRSFTQAAVWAGRTAMELGRPDLGTVYWGWAVELDPQDSRSRYFLAQAERQAEWGIEAAASFDAAMVAYEQGDMETALSGFEAAWRISPGYLEALSWSARVAQELGRFELAASHWERVLLHDPTDEGARYFLRLAEQRLAFGTEVSESFLRGVGHYQQAEFAEALEAFRVVTREDPDFAPAWGYLGQIHFAQRDYSEAAAAYETARSLEPGNEEYVFFAMEARRLAGPRE